MHERDQAGSLHFANGSGQIKAMISMPDALWIFKRDGAYRTTLPDQIDPDRTNPSLPVQKHWYPELGTSDPCVARLFIQPMKMLHELDGRDLDEPKGFKDKLLETCRTMQAVAQRLDGFSATLASLTVAEDRQGRGSFPSVEIPGVAQTNAVVEEVLGNLKRVSQAALNFPHYILGTTYLGNPSFDKVHKELAEKYGESEGIAQIIAIHRDALVQMVDMRNAIEHPREGQRVSITEMRIGASGKLEEPKIVFEHKGSTKEFSMLGYLYDVVARVFNLTEELFVCCVEQKDVGGFPFVVCEIEKNKIDTECPTKYIGSFRPQRPPAPQYRLPTEAEWEQAALAGRRTRFAHGDDEQQLPDYAWFDVLGGPHPVASKLPNRWGFYDMEGNILEITCEFMCKYPGTPQDQHWKTRITGWGGATGWYAARGGAWNMGAVACEPTLRRAVNVESRTYFMGFRIARGPVMPEWDRKDFRVPWAEIFIFAPYRASKAYAAVMQSAPATWPRPSWWKPAENPEMPPRK